MSKTQRTDEPKYTREGKKNKTQNGQRIPKSTNPKSTEI